MKKLAVLTFAALILAACSAKQPEAKSEAAAPKAFEMVIIETAAAPGTGVEDEGLTKGLENYAKGTAKIRKVDYEVAKNSPEFAGMDLSYMPLYLIKKTDDTSKIFDEHIKSGFIKAIGDYIVFEKQTRSGLYVGKPLQKRTLDLFVMSQCPYGAMAENRIIDAKKLDKFPKDVKVNVHYIVSDLGGGNFNSLHGTAEWEEDVRQLIIQQKFPAKFWKYLEERNKDYQSSRWEDAAKKAGVDVNAVGAAWKTGVQLLQKDAVMSKDFGVSGSPTIIWEGRAVMDFGALGNIAGFEYFAQNAGGAPGAPPAGGSC